MLGAYPSVLEDAYYFRAVTTLLRNPFNEALHRFNALRTQTYARVSAVGDKSNQDRIYLIYLEAFLAKLNTTRIPQHGAFPGDTSFSVLTETLHTIDTDLAVMRALLDDSESSDGAKVEQTLRDTLAIVLLRVVNMPVQSGEAEQLVRIWSLVPFTYGDERQNVLHELKGLGYALSCSLLQLDVSSTAGDASVFVADGTPSTPAFPHMTYLESAVGCLEALHVTGMFCVCVRVRFWFVMCLLGPFFWHNAHPFSELVSAVKSARVGLATLRVLFSWHNC